MATKTTQEVFTSTVTDAQRQMSELVNQGQQMFLQTVRSWSESVARMAPSQPNGGSMLREASEAQSQLIDQSYAFTHQVLDNQRDFVKQLVSATRPAVDATVNAAERNTDSAAAATKAASDKASSN